MDNVEEYNDEMLFQQIGPYTPSLPPGSNNMGLPIYGVLEIKIGKLIDFETTANINNIKVKPVFWGENGASPLLNIGNTEVNNAELESSVGIYAIRYNNQLPSLSIQKILGGHEGAEDIHC